MLFMMSVRTPSSLQLAVAQSDHLTAGQIGTSAIHRYEYLPHCRVHADAVLCKVQERESAVGAAFPLL